MTDMEALKITPINKVTPQQALRRYRNSPLSLILRLLVTLSAILTVAVLLFLIAYIVVMGVPNLKPSLFSLEYNSENASLFPVQQNFSRDSAALDQVVHTVQAFEQRGFSAAGRTDKGGDLVGTDTKVDVFQRFEITVVEIQIADRNFIHK